MTKKWLLELSERSLDLEESYIRYIDFRIGRSVVRIEVSPEVYGKAWCMVQQLVRSQVVRSPKVTS